MRIGPVLEVTTSFQNKYGIEIQISSVGQDNSQSWVRILHETIKHVIDSNQNNIEIPADPHEDQTSQTSVKVVAARSKAKAKPQKRELVDTPSIMPMHERNWIDIEPSEPTGSLDDGGGGEGAAASLGGLGKVLRALARRPLEKATTATTLMLATLANRVNAAPVLQVLERRRRHFGARGWVPEDGLDTHSRGSHALGGGPPGAQPTALGGKSKVLIDGLDKLKYGLFRQLDAQGIRQLRGEGAHTRNLTLTGSNGGVLWGARMFIRVRSVLLRPKRLRPIGLRLRPKNFSQRFVRLGPKSPHPLSQPSHLPWCKHSSCKGGARRVGPRRVEGLCVCLLCVCLQCVSAVCVWSKICVLSPDPHPDCRISSLPNLLHHEQHAYEVWNLVTN